MDRRLLLPARPPPASEPVTGGGPPVTCYQVMAVKREYDSNRRQRQAAQTRADILRAARRLFAERGYPATTIEAIATAAEVSEATVYAGFGS
jgi:hypothetical protein